MTTFRRVTLACICFAASVYVHLAAQAPLPNPAAPPVQAPLPAAHPTAELDRIVSPIALYPDPLLAQVLTAATYPDDIPAAAQWADLHHYLSPDELAAAIVADQLPWDPSVQSLLPFPSVLEMMSSALSWTRELGNAVLAQRSDVMDAVQRMRQKASQFGYLHSNSAFAVSGDPYIEILPVDPGVIVVPSYDPAIVFAAPRPGFVVSGAIRIGFGVRIGAAFAPWGWGSTHFGWGEHAIIVNNARWDRTWANRAAYVHPYAVRRYAGPRPPEAHRLIARSPRERSDARQGRAPKEEHRR